MESPKTYNTRLKRRSSEFSPKSRVDWKRTRVDSISLIVDSDETSDSEEEGSESDDSSSVSAEETEERTEEVSGEPEDEGEEEHIKKPRRKSRTTTIESSGSSSDSDAPGTTVPIRRCRAIEEDEDEDKQNRARGEKDEEDKAQFKKKRMDTLKQLAARRRSRSQRVGSESEEEESHDNEFIPLTPESLKQEEEEEEEDSQEMADFIEEDDEEDGSLLSIREVFMKHHMDKFASDDLDSHLQKVIRAFLINIADNTFLETLYNGSRQKRYARDLLKSLNYLDERVITPRLERLTSSCRWTSHYKERVNCYPRLLVRVIEAEKQSCEACKLKRYCKYLVTLSGEAYDGHTLEKDDFLLDDKQFLVHFQYERQGSCYFKRACIRELQRRIMRRFQRHYSVDQLRHKWSDTKRRKPELVHQARLAHRAYRRAQRQGAAAGDGQAPQEPPPRPVEELPPLPSQHSSLSSSPEEPRRDGTPPAMVEEAREEEGELEEPEVDEAVVAEAGEEAVVEEAGEEAREEAVEEEVAAAGEANMAQPVPDLDQRVSMLEVRMGRQEGCLSQILTILRELQQRK